MIGTFLQNRYRLESELGMGMVYRARLPREALGQETLNQAWQAGASTKLEEAIAVALEPGVDNSRCRVKASVSY